MATMWKVLETPRLRLRRFGPGDLDILARWLANAQLMRHLGQPARGGAAAEDTLARYERHWQQHGFGILALEEKATGALVGRSGLAYHRSWPGEPEVGWLVEAPWQGQGLAAEAGGASLRYGFEELGVPRIVSICVEENYASRRVMEKLGLRLLDRVHDPQLGLDLWIHATSAPAA